MSLRNRLEKIAKELNIPGELVIRFGDSDGSYPEAEEDKKQNKKVMLITIDGCSREEIESWAI